MGGTSPEGKTARRGPTGAGRVVTRREVPLDAARILRGLAESGVSYTVIGGLAVALLLSLVVTPTVYALLHRTDA